jgi:hypothetical protein
MGIDDESSHPELYSEVAGGVTRTIVCLFREPDAGNLPVRFDEREPETESSQTGLRRRDESPVNSHRETRAYFINAVESAGSEQSQNDCLPIRKG